MTSQPARSSQQNTGREESIVLVSSSSSEDDDDDSAVSSFQWGQSSSADGRSIRELVREGKRLLTLAEVRSRPEEYRNNGGSVFKYNFSSAVTGCDLFRDRELLELAGVANALRERLSAERIFSLGCPQLRSERDVFDELLMRFSDELLDMGQSAAPVNPVGGSVSGNVNNDFFGIVNPESTPGNDLAPLESRGSGMTLNPGSGTESAGVRDAISLLAQSSDNSSFVVLRKEPRTMMVGSQNRFVPAHTAVDGNGVSAIPTLPEGGAVPASINLSALEEFFRHVNKLNSVTNQQQKAGCSRLYDPTSYDILQAVQSSLSSVMGAASPQTDQAVKQSKRRRIEDENSGSAKKSKIKTEKQNEEDEDKEEDSCSICMEPWSTGGEHRVTCLKCGHLFGLSCIVKWVEQAHCCPQCKTAAKKSDLRHLFVPKITAEDTSQRDRAMRLLEEEKVARRSVEQKEAMARRKLEIQAADIEALKAELSQLKSQLPENGGYSQRSVIAAPKASLTSNSKSVTGNKHFQVLQRVNISQDGNCRVFDHCKQLGLLVASQKSNNTLFRGYGIKILTRDFKPLSYQPLHSAAIRDMSFRPGAYDGMLLSCGLDKCLQLTSVTSKVVVQKYTVSSNVWCCAWNTQNTNLFYAGMEKGVVKEFDIRRTDSHVQDVMDYGGGPISSIQYWSGMVDGNCLQGLLIAHLQNLIFGEHRNDQFTTHQLPHLQAPLMSLSLHPSGKFLASFRPGTHNPKCKYEISNLCQSTQEDSPAAVSSVCQAVWEGSNMQAVISRNSLISKPDTESDLLAVTANHSNNTVSTWDLSSKQEFQVLPCFDKAIDVKPLYEDMLGVLTDKELVLYSWR